MRKVYVVVTSTKSSIIAKVPVMVFTDENDACDFSLKMNDDFSNDYVYECQLAEGNIIEEILCHASAQLDRMEDDK